MDLIDNENDVNDATVASGEEKVENSVDIRALQIKQALSQMTEDQQLRFEYFRRSGFSRSNIREVLNNFLTEGEFASDEMVIVIGASLKVFIGELIEYAREIATSEEHCDMQMSGNASMEGNRESFPDIQHFFSLPTNWDSQFIDSNIQPHHLLKAYRKLQQEGKIHRYMQPSLFSPLGANNSDSVF